MHFLFTKKKMKSQMKSPSSVVVPTAFWGVTENLDCRNLDFSELGCFNTIQILVLVIKTTCIF